jgi:hypothetical protein
MRTGGGSGLATDTRVIQLAHLEARNRAPARVENRLRCARTRSPRTLAARDEDRRELECSPQREACG